MRTRLLLPTAAALALTLGACSSSSSSTSTTTAAPGTTAGTPTTTAAPGTTEASPDTSAVASEEQQQAKLSTLLLTPEDLGARFSEGGFSIGSTPGSCPGAVAPDLPDVQAGTALESIADRIALQQTLGVYRTDAAAEAAFAAGKASFSCGTSTDGGFTLAPPVDVSREMGTDAFLVTARSADSEGVIIFAIHSGLVAFYQFQGATGAADAVGAPDPLEVAAANFATVKAAIG